MIIHTIQALSKKISLLFTAIVFAGVFGESALGQIQVDSMKSTVSTCANNGSISMYAKSPNPPVLYSITAGPVIQPIQTGNTFNSVPAGNYTITISDGLGNSVSRAVSVGGNYQPLDFVPVKTNPVCIGNSNGKIVGTRTANTGKAPFTWQLIAPSTVTTAPQSSDVFDNLPAGNYTMRVTDDCGSYRTLVVTLTDPPASNIRFYTSPAILIGCTTGTVSVYMQMDAIRSPFTYKFETTNGTFTTTTPTSINISPSGTGGYVTVTHVLPNFTYGNSLRVTVTDACGNSAVSPFYYARPFSFCPSYTSIFRNCAYQTSTILSLNNFNCFASNNMNTSMTAPVSYQAIDVATGLTVDSGTANYNTSGISFKPVPGNKTYKFIIKDGCGNTFTQSYTIVNPTAPNPSYTRSVNKSGCIDSVGTLQVNTDNFRSVPSLILLSGPSTLGSTKPGYTYTGTYTYPDTFSYTSWGGGVDARYNFEVNNLAPGTYTFKLIDSCGTERFDSFIIQKTQVTNLGHTFSYKKGCLGKNQIRYTVNTGNGSMFVSPLNLYKYYSTYGVLQTTDSILNVPSGTYDLTFRYNPLYGQQANSVPIACQVIQETVVIKGYETPEISTSNSIMCRNAVNIELLPDSSKGVPPYKYEIFSGPQIFPIQNSNIFTANQPGTYNARIYDVCGNASTKAISVGTVSTPFIPANATRTCTKAQFIFPASLYYTYKWVKPGNVAFTGPSLSIDPITAADTGTYSIMRITNINGCRDTIRASYHVSLSNSYPQSKTICRNQSVTIGTHTYSIAGVYSDTLISSTGCDSIIKLTLTVIDYKRHSISQSICPGKSISFGGHLYSSPGIYNDTLTTSTCDSIVQLTLTILDYKRHSISQSICPGKSISFGGHLYSSPGIYNDTLTTSTCDSIVQLTLTPLDYKRHTISRSVCPGKTISFGGHLYSNPGTYNDTLTTSGCDSIVTLNLTLASLPVVTLGNDTSICQGQSLTMDPGAGYAAYFWNNILSDSIHQTLSANNPGQYTITVKNAEGCTASDTLKITNVYPLPIASAGQDKKSCAGQTVTLSASGGNSYQWMPGGQTTSTIQVTPNVTSTYQLIAYDIHHCASLVKTATIYIHALPSVAVFETPQAEHCFDDDSYTISAAWGKSFLWLQTGATTQSITINQAGTYSVTVSDEYGCPATGEISVQERCNPKIFVPNAFSPNSDGENDDLEIFGKHFKDFEIKIFNRWGEIIFISTDRNKRWDGFYRGEEMPIGTYPWVIKYKNEYENNPEENTLKGSVTLIR